MRITESTFYSLARQSIARRRSELARVQAQIASGRKNESLGSDPQATRTVLRDESLQREVDSNLTNIGQAENLLSQADFSLGEVAEVIFRVKELAIQLGNDTYSAENRLAGAEEMSKQKEWLAQLGNTKIAGRYIFGGLANNGSPFDAAGNFSGDDQQLKIPVGGGAFIDATLPGGYPFVDGGGNSVFQTMDDLIAALSSNDGAQIRALIGDVDDALQRITGAQQEVGQNRVRLDGAKAAMNRVKEAAEIGLANSRDTDFVDAVVRLRESESGLQAALTITSRLQSLSLVEMLG